MYSPSGLKTRPADCHSYINPLILNIYTRKALTNSFKLLIIKVEIIGGGGAGMNQPYKRGLSFRNKLIISFLLVSLLPMLAVQMVSYYVSSGAMKAKINDLVKVNLLQTSKKSGYFSASL